MDYRLAVAMIFKIAAMIGGLPSIPVFVLSTIGFVWLYIAPARPDKVTSGDSLLDLLLFVPIGIAKLFAGMMAGVKWVCLGLSLVSLLTLAFSAMLFFTSRGIADQKTWARFTGMGLASLPLLLGLLMMLSTRQPFPFSIGIAVTAASGFVIYSLGFRFA
jgi:hypothetical protein